MSGNARKSVRIFVYSWIVLVLSDASPQTNQIRPTSRQTKTTGASSASDDHASPPSFLVGRRSRLSQLSGHQVARGAVARLQRSAAGRRLRPFVFYSSSHFTWVIFCMGTLCYLDRS
jgi:hypothetical protein